MSVRAWLGAAALLATLVATRTAGAAHVEGGEIQLPGAGHDRVGVELETARFDLGTQGQGSYFSTIARVDWAATRRLTLRTRVPLHFLDLAGQAGREGLGDVEVRLRWRLTMRDPLLVAVGYTGQLPTGDDARGLGGGALQLAPYATAGYRIDATVIFVTLNDTLTLRSASTLRLPSSKRSVNYVDPNSDHELRYNAGLIYFFSDVVAASAMLNGVTILTDEERGHTLFTGGAQLGIAPLPGWRFVIGGQLPILGDKRFDWKLNAALIYSF